MKSRTTSSGLYYWLLVGAERGMAALLSALPTSRARMEGGRWLSEGPEVAERGRRLSRAAAGLMPKLRSDLDIGFVKPIPAASIST